jgi:hypothetical protein
MVRATMKMNKNCGLQTCNEDGEKLSIYEEVFEVLIRKLVTE